LLLILLLLSISIKKEKRKTYTPIFNIYYMKVCCKCKIEKDIKDFAKCKTNKDGLQKRCKMCHNSLYSKNEIRERNKKYSENLTDDKKEKRKEYYKNWSNENKEKLNEIKRNYYKNNKEKVNEIKKRYSDKNKDKIKNRMKSYRQIDEVKERSRNYINERRNFLRKTDDFYRLKERIRGSINRSFNYKKPKSTNEILGCSFEEFKVYLESKFEYWMKWNNRGLYNGEFNYGWDIDHIIPISTAKNIEDLVRLNHYTNLQPLCSKINRDIKRDFY